MNFNIYGVSEFFENPVDSIPLLRKTMNVHIDTYTHTHTHTHTHAYLMYAHTILNMILRLHQFQLTRLQVSLPTENVLYLLIISTVPSCSINLVWNKQYWTQALTRKHFLYLYSMQYLAQCLGHKSNLINICRIKLNSAFFVSWRNTNYRDIGRWG